MVLARDEVISIIKGFKDDPELKDYRFGLAGSYARGTNKKRSDVDVVVDCDGMPYEKVAYIRDKFKGVKVDVLDLRVMKVADEEMDEFIRKRGLTVDERSPYKEIQREVIWFE